MEWLSRLIKVNNKLDKVLIVLSEYEKELAELRVSNIQLKADNAKLRNENLLLLERVEQHNTVKNEIKTRVERLLNAMSL